MFFTALDRIILGGHLISRRGFLLEVHMSSIEYSYSLTIPFNFANMQFVFWVENPIQYSKNF